MLAPREFHHRDDLVVITIDIEDCPLVEFPLCEVFDCTTSSLVEDYLEVLHDYVTQILEDTPWLDKQSTSQLLRASIGVFYRRNQVEIISMRKPALQRLITQFLHSRVCICHKIQVPIFIRLLRPEIDLPCKTKFPPPLPSLTNICMGTNCDHENDWGGGASCITRDHDDATNLLVDMASSTMRNRMCGSLLIDGIEATANASLTASTAKLSGRDINLDDASKCEAPFSDCVALVMVVEDRVYVKTTGNNISLSPPDILLSTASIPCPCANLTKPYPMHPLP